MQPLSRQQRSEALEKARRERLEREARGELTPLDEWGKRHLDGLPENASAEEIREFEEACRASGL